MNVLALRLSSRVYKVLHRTRSFPTNINITKVSPSGFANMSRHL